MPENGSVASNGISETIALASKRDLNGTKEPENQSYPTIEEFRKAIPERCFEKSLVRSMGYFVGDVAIIVGLYFLVGPIEQYAGWIGLIAWYWFMGMFGFALFVVGHDCGHGSFSNYQWINDIVGNLAHGFLMVPYWPWQKSHRIHHKFTGNLQKDHGHPWITKEDYEARSWLANEFTKFPLSASIRWFLYLLGMHDGSHIWPFSRLFSNNVERIQCALSVTVCALFSFMMATLFDYNLTSFIKYYVIPLLSHGLWIVMITYLHHQDEAIEVFDNNSWTFVKGALQTVDRTYGFGVDTLLHHITDGHVVHHLFFTKIPHYHLAEATKAAQKVLEKYPGIYIKRSTYAYLYEFWKLSTNLDFLIPTKNGVLKYRIAAKNN